MALRRFFGFTDGELMRADCKPCSTLMKHTATIFTVGGGIGFWVLCRLHYGTRMTLPRTLRWAACGAVSVSSATALLVRLFMPECEPQNIAAYDSQMKTSSLLDPRVGWGSTVSGAVLVVSVHEFEIDVSRRDLVDKYADRLIHYYAYVPITQPHSLINLTPLILRPHVIMLLFMVCNFIFTWIVYVATFALEVINFQGNNQLSRK